MTDAQFMWPDPVTPLRRGEFQFYLVPGVGELPRVTSILETYGFGHHRLGNWKAEEQQKATINSAWRVTLSQNWYPDAFKLFKFRVEQAVGAEKAADKIRDEAAEIGTAAHRHIRWWLEGATGIEPILERGESRLAALSFQNWFASSGLTPVRTEQFIYSKKMGCAGTIDVVVEDPKLGLGILDVKSSKGIYEQHHYQVGGYFSAACELGAEINWAKLVRVPKYLEDPIIAKGGVEVVDLGALWGRKPMTPDRVRLIFANLCETWHMRFSSTLEDVGHG